MSAPTSSRGLALVLVLGLGLVACSRGLPAGDETVDLTPSGYNVTMSVPRGVVVEKVGDEVELRWGPHGEDGTLRVRRSGTFGCPAGDSDCKVVESGDRRVIVERTMSQKRQTYGNAKASFGAESIICETSGALADIKRLLEGCAAAKPTSPSSSSTAALSSGVAPSPQPKLEGKSFADSKAKYSIALPSDFRDEKTPAGGRMFVETGSKATVLPMTVTVTPFVPIGSMTAAEKEAKQLDIGGLDTIGTKRELGPKSFLVATSPRGSLKLVKVHVFVSNAKTGLYVKCEGTAANQATLEAICSSLKLE